MTGPRSHEYTSGVLHSPAPRAAWLESKVPQEGKDGRLCVRSVMTAHVEEYEVCVLSPHHPSCLQKSTQECHSQPGRQPDSLAFHSDRDLATGPSTYNSPIILKTQWTSTYRCLERSWRYGARSMPRYVFTELLLRAHHGRESHSNPQPTWELLEGERKDLKMKLQPGVPDLSSPTLQITVFKSDCAHWQYNISIATKTC